MHHAMHIPEVMTSLITSRMESKVLLSLWPPYCRNGISLVATSFSDFSFGIVSDTRALSLSCHPINCHWKSQEVIKLLMMFPMAIVHVLCGDGFRGPPDPYLT